MPQAAAAAAADIGSGSRHVRKGFKADRAARYQARVDRNLGKKPDPTKESGDAVVKPTKKLLFDAASRKEFLLGLHKRKNERRVKAVTEAQRKAKKSNRKLRQEIREEARHTYNRY